MSIISEQSRGEQAETRSVTSVAVESVRRVSPTQSQLQQQRSNSQVDRMERNGRGERHRIQRSSSSSSTRSASTGGERRTNGRSEGAGGTGSYQQPSSESGYTQGGTVTGSYGASGGSFGSLPTGERRPGRHRKEVIRCPEQSRGPTRQVRRRLPTPEPDILERVYIQPTGAECIEEITEIPTTPPPRLQERTVVEPAGPPQVIKRVVRVPPRSGGGYQQPQPPAGCGQQLQPQPQPQQQVPAGCGSFSNLAGASSYGNIQQAANGYQQPTGGSYSNIQQAATSYQQPTGASYSGNYSGATAVSGSYSSPSASYGSTAAGYGSGSASYGSAGASYGSASGSYGSAAPSYGSAGASYGTAAGSRPAQAPIIFSVGGEGHPTQVLPPLGCHPAFCFYA
jgi:hypothetical protein